jgi:N-acetylmuramoyl-L-alanine amidase
MTLPDLVFSGRGIGLPVMCSAYDLDIMARTIYGEARNQPFVGMVAVAQVIVRRCRGKAPADICLARLQFSCWNKTDPNLRLVATVNPVSHAMLKARAAACIALAGLAEDVTGEATNYLTTWLAADPKAPSWWAELQVTVTIGDHVFARPRRDGE